MRDSRGWLGTDALAIKETVSTCVFKKFVFHWSWGWAEDRQLKKKRLMRGYSSGKLETTEWEKKHLDVCLV